MIKSLKQNPLKQNPLKVRLNYDDIVEMIPQEIDRNSVFNQHCTPRQVIDELESLGIVGGYSGSKARDILVDESYINDIFNK